MPSQPLDAGAGGARARRRVGAGRSWYRADRDLLEGGSTGDTSSPMSRPGAASLELTRTVAGAMADSTVNL